MTTMNDEVSSPYYNVIKRIPLNPVKMKLYLRGKKKLVTELWKNITANWAEFVLAKCRNLRLFLQCLDMDDFDIAKGVIALKLVTKVRVLSMVT
ncbi:hypothetical protein HOLleu_37421 [Holothuria leucospilota]|uniref:Uncharacterized protein n=1 Tax=Holothuria leucospilota TaxID=206669 RepID=A0A9Q0YHC3_HOLLE|nr:hypothetical protein HOLleu_37421 [Holothuria leucospilota]